MRISSLIPVVGLLLTGVVAASGPRCPVVEAPPAASCFASPYGLAYADTAEEAEVASRAIGEAAQRYASYFERAPVGMLLLSTQVDATQATAFAKSNDLAFALVWVPAKAMRTMTERAMRQAGVDRSRIREALARADAQEAITLRHEAGHAMYEAMFWPDAVRTLEERYGTPAPDWLDEAVAISMETPESQARHLAAFIGVAKQRRREIPGFADFLAAEHPVRSAALASALSRGPRSDSGVQMMVTSSGGFAGLETFYGQSLLTGLFLAEMSGDPKILAPISSAVAEGLDFSAWLARDGTRYNLPETVEALEPRWNEWLQQQVLRAGRNSAR
ncbi:conserved exported hypothetical protein [Luteimonas sp. 9C]|uniref:hypothetical protein n=1 Tax=Luteimonas sp. 9C TaxID=2653148 RepID=UPI0012F2B845|nr:hypothetical protein [Luteimonas sp. 9C]VXB87838.1 conserved exported hypothetical protein [Luteimonas sp. 9C]